MGTRFLTRTAVADRLAINRRTLEAWERRGIGPPVIRTPGANPRYLESDLDAWIDRHRVMPAAEGMCV